MASGKQTPRQKLIGLMYLVFLALMALQVSREVLDSVVLIDNEIKLTNKSLNQRISSTLNAFEQQMFVSPERVKPIYDQAKIVQELSDELVEFILEKRAEMLSHIDGIATEVASELNLFELRNKENYSSSTRFWLTTGEFDAAVTGGPGSRAYELRKKILEYKEKLKPILEGYELMERVNLGLEVEEMYPGAGGGGSVNWQQNMFDRVIPVAVATNLTRLVTEVRNAEFDVVNNLYGRIAADSYTFNEISARVVPSSTVVMQGDDFTADVFVAAYDSKQQPDITMSGRKIDVKDGVGRIRIPATRPGKQSYSGRITVKDPSGRPRDYNFDGEFVVQPPSATVSADKMNVVYVGLPNPLSISAPGVASENVRPQATGGTLTPLGGGRYNFVPAQGAREAVVRVDALIGGELRNMGTQTFRVRPIPPPTAFIANRKEGRVTREELIAAGSIIPSLENFEFDYNYEIASFTFITIEGGDASRKISESNRLTPEMITAIRNAGRDQVVTFMDIVTKPGPDGRPLRLGSISLNVQ